MSLRWVDWPVEVLAALRTGVVIPAHPLALDAQRKLDPRRQRALTRYYLDAGSGGLAVGVHTTQFAIREAGLYKPVLELAIRTATEWSGRPLVMIAGAVGRTTQAVKEAQIARGLGYHAVLLSLAAMQGASEDELIAHARAVAQEIPLGGLLPAARRRRDRLAGIVLAALRRDRERGGDQDRAVQPLSHARRGARRRGGRRRRARDALHRQRRPHHSGFGDALCRALPRCGRHHAHQGRAAGTLERLGPQGGGIARTGAPSRGSRQPFRPNCSPSTRR